MATLILLGLAPAFSPAARLQHSSQRLASRLAASRASVQAALEPLRETNSPIEIEPFMGRWYVLAAIPTVIDRGATNAIEDYSWNSEGECIDIRFQMQKGSTSALETTILQRATIASPTNTRWSLSPKIGPFYLPLGLPYLVADCAPDYSTTISKPAPVQSLGHALALARRHSRSTHLTQPEVAPLVAVGLPDRSILYIMARTPTPEAGVLDALIAKSAALGYDVSKVERIVHDYASS